MIHFLSSFFKLPTCLSPTKTQRWISQLGPPNTSSPTSRLCFFPATRGILSANVSPLLIAAVAAHGPQASIPTRGLHLSQATSCATFILPLCPLAGATPNPLHVLSILPQDLCTCCSSSQNVPPPTLLPELDPPPVGSHLGLPRVFTCCSLSALCFPHDCVCRRDGCVRVPARLGARWGQEQGLRHPSPARPGDVCGGGVTNRMNV